MACLITNGTLPASEALTAGTLLVAAGTVTAVRTRVLAIGSERLSLADHSLRGLLQPLALVGRKLGWKRIVWSRCRRRSELDHSCACDAIFVQSPAGVTATAIRAFRVHAFLLTIVCTRLGTLININTPATIVAEEKPASTFTPVAALCIETSVCCVTAALADVALIRILASNLVRTDLKSQRTHTHWLVPLYGAVVLATGVLTLAYRLNLNGS